LSYNTAQKQSRHKEEFGKGTLEGIAASEAGNNGVTGATLIPLLTLGIPGDAVTAVLMGALMIQGLTPGPLLFETDGNTIYGIFALLIVCNVFMLMLGRLGLPLFRRVTDIPSSSLQPIVLALCCIGTYASSTRRYELVVMLVVGAVAFVMRKLSMPSAPALLALILGGTIESNLRRGLVAKRGSLIAMFSGRPIAIAILVITLVMLVYSAVSEVKGKKVTD
jgi:putative tricarboxylic transport membrane protein